MINQSKLILYLLSLLVLTRLLPAAEWNTLPQKIETRFTQAQLAFEDKKIKEAVLLLQQNLDEKFFHLDSLQLLAKIYFEEGEIIRAMKVYYVIIKKIHTPLLLECADFNYLNQLLSSVPNADSIAAEIYFKLAVIWYNLHQQELYIKSYQQSLLNQAKKYFIIASYYQFNADQASYYLALIERENKNYSGSIDNFYDAEKLNRQDFLKNQDRIDSLRFLLADTLIKEGHENSGTVYMKSVYFNPSASFALRKKAREYLDSLYQQKFSFSATLGGEYDSNLHDLTLTQREELDTDLYPAESGWRILKRANFLYSSRRHRVWSYFLSGSFEEKNTLNAESNHADQRRMVGGVELKNNQLTGGIVRLNYNYLYWSERLEVGANYSKEKSSHQLMPQYTHPVLSAWLKGTMDYQFPLYMNKYQQSSTVNTDYGFRFSYTPFITNQFYAPTYSAGMLISQLPEYTDTIYQYQFTLANFIKYFHPHDFYLNCDYQSVTGPMDEAYTEMIVNLTYVYRFNFIKNLFFDLPLTRRVRWKQDKDRITNWYLGINFSYSF